MNGSMSVCEVETWRRRLGLLAVPLASGDLRRFVMLNGSRGNFCLDFSGTTTSGEARSMSWSTDVGHHVLVGPESIRVQRWDRGPLERATYDAAEIYQNFDEFRRILEQSEPDRDKSIVRHATRVYGTIRTLLRESQPGERSIRAFLAALAWAIADVATISEIDIEAWGLDPLTLSAIDDISPEDWDLVIKTLRAGEAGIRLRPDLPSMLRHAAGTVFQEAHYLAATPISEQMMLGGILPAPTLSARKSTAAQGVFFTPSYLARTLVESLISNISLDVETLTIFDPACGSGELLRECVRQLEQHNYGGEIHLIGWDASSIACAMARFALKWEERTSGLRVTSKVLKRDSAMMENEWPRNASAVVMNPPFVSYERLTPDHADEIRRLMGGAAGQRPDLAALFLHLAIRSLGEGGAVASILPASLLDSKSARGLRDEIWSTTPPVFIARLGDLTLFTNALVETALTVVKKADPSTRIMLWADHSKDAISTAMRALRRFDGTPIALPGYSIYCEDARDNADWSPRPYNTILAFQAFRQHKTVRDMFEIRQGLRTGHNPTFVLDLSSWEALPESEQRYFRNALVNRSIRNGRIIDPIKVFYPYGVRRITSEEHLRHEVGTYYRETLAPAKDSLLKRKKIDPERWWELTWPRLRPIEDSRLVSTAFGRRGSWAWDESGEYVVLNGFFWYPRLTRKAKKFDRMPDLVALGYLAVLNSAMFDDLLGATSRQVGGGQWDLQNRFVYDLPLPDLYDPSVPIDVLNRLAAIGQALHSGIPADEREWKSAVSLAYQTEP